MTFAGRYWPVMLLGRGGWCEIWLGLLKGPAGFQKPLVLKRAFAGAHQDIEESKRMLVAEAKVCASLNHPNTIHIYELIDAPEGLMLAMEYLPGFTLRALSRAVIKAGGGVPWPITARIVADAARGLDHAHNAKTTLGEALNAIHRDVNPENLVLTEEGITKVVDFGIARSSMSEATTSLVIKGKLGYLSPEQARGDHLDWRTDVFSLGVVLHEMISGHRLFLRDDVGKTLDAIMSLPIPPLPSSVAPVLGDMVQMMLIRDVSRRVVTMREVADALESVAIDGGSHQDTAAFLHAMLGSEIETRQARIEKVLSKPAFRSAQPSHQESTMTVIETMLDGVWRDGDSSTAGTIGQSESDEADTEVNDGLPATLVERPLSKDSGGQSERGE